jgi:hypothetical protein
MVEEVFGVGRRLAVLALGGCQILLAAHFEVFVGTSCCVRRHLEEEETLLILCSIVCLRSTV